jgi:hypothetical protein
MAGGGPTPGPGKLGNRSDPECRRDRSGPLCVRGTERGGELPPVDING